MKIVSLKLVNFRGFKNETIIKFNDLTALVGKNDIGKSTILEALDIFFNDGKGAVKIDKNDVNVENAQNGNLETIITVCFSDLPKSIVIDSSATTSLENEYMLNSNDNLEITKKYKNGSATTYKVFIHALHPTNTKCSDLLLKKNSELKKIIRDESIECENQTINSVMRSAIWNHFKDDLQLNEIEIDVSKEDAKKIWDKLALLLPVYSLFQADRKNTDSDNEVQDPLKEAVKEILSDESLQEKLTEVAEEVRQKLQEVSDRTLEKLREMDEQLADSLKPVIPEVNVLKWPDVFKNVSIAGDSDIPINKRGSGVKRLILLNFFRAEAERKAIESSSGNIIYAIEEPETSQHTNNQVVLINALKSMASSGKSQVIISTHSAVIVKQLDFSNLRIIKNDETNNKIILGALPGQLQYPSLNEVNYTAFNEITEEYHNELYGFLEMHKLLNEYKQGKKTRLYKRKLDNGTIKEEQKILSEYIRHLIHHPDNTENKPYTKEELKKSIKDMRSFITSKKSITGIINESE